jgi:hypothetical protein
MLVAAIRPTSTYFLGVLASLLHSPNPIKTISLIAISSVLLSLNAQPLSSVFDAYAQTQSGPATSGNASSGPFTFYCSAANACSLEGPKSGPAKSGSANSETTTTEPQTPHQNFTLPSTGRRIQYDLPLIPIQCTTPPKPVIYCFNTPDGITAARFWGVLSPSPDPIQSVQILSSLAGARLINGRGIISPSGTLYTMFIYEQPIGSFWGGVSIVETSSLYVIDFPLFMYQNHREQITTMLRSLVYDPRCC